ncbi:MAG: hypothetical protein Q9179_003474 [Wetmoreana sp. 5 TL-2023]
MAALEQYRPPTPMDHEESGRIDATEIESRKEAENILEILLIDVRNRYEIAERHFKGEATKMIEEHVDMLLREHAASIRLAKGVEAALKPSTKQGHSPAAAPTANHVIKRPPQFGTNNPRPFKCAICDGTFTQRRHVKDHFQYCVARNGNPDARHWFDSPSILATYRPDWKGTVAITNRYNHHDKATGDVPKQKLDRKVVQGSGNACGPVMPKSYIPEDEWVAYREWRKGLGDKRL